MRFSQDDGGSSPMATADDKLAVRTLIGGEAQHLHSRPWRTLQEPGRMELNPL